jgi:hypothetical protein
VPVVNVTYVIMQTFGPNPAQWQNSTGRCQNLGGILLGMNVTQMMQCNLTAPNVAMAAGKLESNASSDVVRLNTDTTTHNVNLMFKLPRS